MPAAVKQQKMAVAYFRCVEGTGFYDKVISWYSRSRFTHAELHWPLTDIHPAGYLGAQTSGGVQIRPANYLNGMFMVFGVRVTPSQLAQIETIARAQVGLPYDWKAIAAMGLSWLRGPVSTKSWFCSELVAYCFSQAGVPLLRVPSSKSDVLTPRDLSISTVAKVF